MKQKPLAFAAIGILIVFGLFYWWQNQDEQVLNQKIDTLVESLEYRKVSLDNRENRHEAMRSVMAERVSFEGSPPVPSGEISIDEVIIQLDFLQSFATWIEFIESERVIQIDGDTAKVTATWDIKAAVGKQFQTREIWKVIIDFEKQDEWRIVHINAVTQGKSAAAGL